MPCNPLRRPPIELRHCSPSNEEFGLKNLQLIADKIHLIRLSPRGGVGADWGTEAFQINFA
jgi:hypothetical protein